MAILNELQNPQLMGQDRNHHRNHHREWMIAAITLALSLSTALFGAGYSYRKVEDLIPRVTAMEKEGSIQAQISAKDIQWLKDNNAELLIEVREIRALLNQHIVRATPKGQ